MIGEQRYSLSVLIDEDLKLKNVITALSYGEEILSNRQQEEIYQTHPSGVMIRAVIAQYRKK